MSRCSPPVAYTPDVRIRLGLCQGTVRLCGPPVRPLGDVGNARNGRIHFLLRIESADGESHATISRDRSKLRMHQRCAMQTGAGGDVVVHIEHDTDVPRIDAPQVHKDGREVVCKVVAAVQLDAFNLPETIHQSLCQLHLARMDIRDAVLVQPVLSGPQRGHADHVWRAVFKPPGILLEMERMDRPNAGAAAAHLFDAYVLANTKAADAHAPHERFVAGEGNHIDVHLPHVDRNDADGLSGIHDEPDAALAADRPNLLDWLYRTDHVRSVVDDHKLRVRPYGLGDIVRVHEPGVVERDEGRLCAVVADHVVDGPDHGVVFEVGGDVMVTRRNQPRND